MRTHAMHSRNTSPPTLGLSIRTNRYTSSRARSFLSRASSSSPTRGSATCATSRFLWTQTPTSASSAASPATCATGAAPQMTCLRSGCRQVCAPRFLPHVRRCCCIHRVYVLFAFVRAVGEVGACVFARRVCAVDADRYARHTFGYMCGYVCVHRVPMLLFLCERGLRYNMRVCATDAKTSRSHNPF